MSTDTEIIFRKLFSVEEFQRISDAGIFPPDSRFELIRGEIIEMPNPTRLHSGRVNKLIWRASEYFTTVLNCH